MSDRYYAKITIGGPIPESLKLQVAEAIAVEMPFEEIELTERNQIVLSCCEIRNGEFEELESVLEALNIPYDRYSGSYYEYPPCQKHFRPGVETMEYSLTCDGMAFFDQDVIQGVIDSMPPEEAVGVIRGMLTIEPPLPGIDDQAIEDFLLQVAEKGMPEEQANETV